MEFFCSLVSVLFSMQFHEREVVCVYVNKMIVNTLHNPNLALALARAGSAQASAVHYIRCGLCKMHKWHLLYSSQANSDP